MVQNHLNKFSILLQWKALEAILFHGAEPFEQIFNTPSMEGPMWNLVKTGQAVSEKKTFKDNNLYL